MISPSLRSGRRELITARFASADASLRDKCPGGIPGLLK
jgi:hypothetical protein